MADNVQNKRGNKAGLPVLADGEFGLCNDTKELYIGLNGVNIPVLTLSEAQGKTLGIDTAATSGSGNLITSGAVFNAMQGAASGVDFTTDDTLSFENGVLSVNTADAVEADNTLPVTSAAVNTTVGNIEIILSTI